MRGISMGENTWYRVCSPSKLEGEFPYGLRLTKSLRCVYSFPQKIPRMDMTKTFSTTLLLFHCVALCLYPARATTLSSNLGETASSTEFVGDDTWITSSFATDSSAYLLSNAVLLLSGTSDATARLYLYSNDNGQPGVGNAR